VNDQVSIICVYREIIHLNPRPVETLLALVSRIDYWKLKIEY